MVSQWIQVSAREPLFSWAKLDAGATNNHMQLSHRLFIFRDKIANRNGQEGLTATVVEETEGLTPTPLTTKERKSL